VSWSGCRGRQFGTKILGNENEKATAGFQRESICAELKTQFPFRFSASVRKSPTDFKLLKWEKNTRQFPKMTALSWYNGYAPIYFVKQKSLDSNSWTITRNIFLVICREKPRSITKCGDIFVLLFICAERRRLYGSKKTISSEQPIKST